MKKLITLLLAAVMMTTMFSCAVNIGTNEDVTGSIETKGDPDPEETTEKPEETTAEPEETISEPEETTAEPEETVSDDIIGENAGITYQNKYFNNMVVLDEGWELKTDEEIREINEATLGAVPDNYAEAMKKAAAFTDMMATALDGLASINVGIQNLSGIPGASLLTEKMIMESTVGVLVESYENMGYTDIECNVDQIPFCGEDRQGIVLSAKLNGIDVYMKEIIIMKGNYYECVGVSSVMDDITDNILGMFTLIG